LRDECLNANQFLSIEDARSKIEAWRMDYNHLRPHSSLGQKQPGGALGKGNDRDDCAAFFPEINGTKTGPISNQPRTQAPGRTKTGAPHSVAPESRALLRRTAARRPLRAPGRVPEGSGKRRAPCLRGE
jgi:hypothetical protein